MFFLVMILGLTHNYILVSIVVKSASIQIITDNRGFRHTGTLTNKHNNIPVVAIMISVRVLRRSKIPQLKA